MTAATVIEQQIFVPGLRVGIINGQNDNTSSFGFNNVAGAVLTNSDDDEFASITAISAGVATIGLVDDTGSAVTTDRDIYFVAWGSD